MGSGRFAFSILRNGLVPGGGDIKMNSGNESVVGPDGILVAIVRDGEVVMVGVDDTLGVEDRQKEVELREQIKEDVQEWVEGQEG
jgi:hypothetical protein